MADQTTTDAGSLRANARDFVHGAVGFETLRGGWFAPLRMTADQMRALGSVAALYPGQFKGMARCTAGITLEFSTNASTVAIELRRVPEPQGTRFVLGEIAKHDEKGVSLIEDFTVEIDGKEQPYLQYFESSLYIDVAGNTGRLPGFGDTHAFCVHLPVMRGVELREISCDGSFIEPVAERPAILALGDSIVQGYAASSPARTWTALLGRSLGAEVINQGIGAQVFQPYTVPRLERTPMAIVVSYGENYRYESMPFSRIEADVRAYLAELAHVFEDVPVFVISPLWHDEQASPSKNAESLAFVRLLLEELCDELGFAFVDGARLLDADPALFADGYEHPGDSGMAIIADRLALVMRERLEGEDALRARALELLAKAPMTAFPLAEQIRRGLGEVRAADEQAIFLFDRPYNQTLYATNRHAARDVLSLFVEPAFLCMLGRTGLRDAQYILGMHRLMPCYLAVYEKTAAPDDHTGFDIRALDASFADVFREHYEHLDLIDEGKIEAFLREGKILGVFEKGELAGFIGEHEEGAIGMLNIFDEHRRKGLAQALLSAKVAQHLAKGYVPWSEIWPENEVSLKLHEKLGFTIYPAEGMTFMNAPAYD